jgi:hypothetical protein
VIGMVDPLMTLERQTRLQLGAAYFTKMLLHQD